MTSSRGNLFIAPVAQPTALLERLRAARWFGGKSLEIGSLELVDRVRWTPDDELQLIKVVYTHGAPETYVMTNEFPEPRVGRMLLQQFKSAAGVRTEHGGTLEFTPTRIMDAIEHERTEPVVQMRGEQSNTSVRFGDALILKLFRRLQFGSNPDVEIGVFLTEHTDFRGTPAVAGNLDYVSADGERASLALLQCFEANTGDAWTTTLRRLSEVLDGASLDESAHAAARLGTTTAELHVALASGTGAFAPERIDAHDTASWHAAIHAEVQQAIEALRRRGIDVDQGALLERADGIDTLEGTGKTRHHGDYHLGQVLEKQDGRFVIIDFEGEPSKPLAQRREKRSPLRDVAGMLRSFDYARNAALRAAQHGNPEERAAAWYASVRETFLDAYLSHMRRHSTDLLPADPLPALKALELEKAVYEVLYELNNRPDWLAIPLAALSA